MVARSAISTVITTTAIFCLVLSCSWMFLFGITSGDWSDWKQATCIPDDCFCEKPRGNLLQQPVNSWSNMAFALSGCVILILIGHDLEKIHQSDSLLGSNTKMEAYQKLASDIWFYGLVYAMAGYFLANTSGFYHASLTFVGQFLDNIGMYLIVCWGFAYNCIRPCAYQKNASNNQNIPEEDVIHMNHIETNADDTQIQQQQQQQQVDDEYSINETRRRRNGGRNPNHLWKSLNMLNYNHLTFFMIYIALLLLFGVINLFFSAIRRYAFFAMILSYILSQYIVDRIIIYRKCGRYPQIQYRYWFLALITLITGFSIWILDLTKILCYPTSLFQGHAVWHIVDALSSFLMYFFYRTETLQPEHLSLLSSPTHVQNSETQSEERSSEEGHQKIIELLSDEDFHDK